MTNPLQGHEAEVSRKMSEKDYSGAEVEMSVLKRQASSPRGNVRGDAWRKSGRRTKNEAEIDMELNPIYTLAGLGEGISNLDDVRKIEAEKKRQEEARMEEERRKQAAILEDNARIKKQMQEAERNAVAGAPKIEKKKKEFK